MRSLFHVALFLVLLAVVTFADGKDLEGVWTLKYVSGLAMKTIGGAEFDFKADGNDLTGKADVGHGWPGKAPISNGKVDGDHISFTVLGLQSSSSGFPKMEFVGAIHGDEIQLTMTFYSDGTHVQGRTELKGKRAPNQ